MRIMSKSNPVFNPEEIIKKEARGINNSFLGQVQEITSDYIVVERGTVEKERYIFSKKLFDRYDGHNVWFRVTEEQYKKYKRE
jgi:hypothetical protein